MRYTGWGIRGRKLGVSRHDGARISRKPPSFPVTPTPHSRPQPQEAPVATAPPPRPPWLGPHLQATRAARTPSPSRPALARPRGRARRRWPPLLQYPPSGDAGGRGARPRSAVHILPRITVRQRVPSSSRQGGGRRGRSMKRPSRLGGVAPKPSVRAIRYCGGERGVKEMGGRGGTKRDRHKNQEGGSGRFDRSVIARLQSHIRQRDRQHRPQSSSNPPPRRDQRRAGRRP